MTEQTVGRIEGIVFDKSGQLGPVVLMRGRLCGEHLVALEYWAMVINPVSWKPPERVKYYNVQIYASATAALHPSLVQHWRKSTGRHELSQQPS